MKTEEEKAKNREYMRRYLAGRKNDPVWVAAERERCRLKNAKKRATDPAYREQERAARKRYYAQNRERLIAQNREWYAAHPGYQNKKVRQYRRANPAKFLVRHARDRAKTLGLAFNITVDDVVIPTHCQVLGIEIKIAAKGFDRASPSIDRILPALGYVRGNIRVISYRANELKKDASADELIRVANWLTRETARVERELAG